MQRVLKLDEALLLIVRRWQAPYVTQLMRSFTRMGDASTWTLVSLALVTTGKPNSRYGRLIGFGALAGTGVSQVLKRVWRRKRPSSGIRGFTALMENPDAFSFPSGHTAAAFSVATAMAGAGGWMSPLYLGLALGIGLSRVYLGAHYPLDVVVGAALGAFAGAVTRAAVDIVRLPPPREAAVAPPQPAM